MSSVGFIRFWVGALPLRTLGVLVAISFASGCFATETALSPGKASETNTQDASRAYLRLQEQLHATQLAIERNRHEAAVFAENTKAIANRLRRLEPGPILQPAPEPAAMPSSDGGMLVVAGLLAAVGLLAMLSTAFFQWRAMNRLGEASAALLGARPLRAGSPCVALGARETRVVTACPVEQPARQLLGALEQLEKLVRQLEQSSNPPLPKVASAAPARAALAPDGSRIGMLLGKGQVLLNLDQAKAALACFDQVLALDPNHPEALVKKGAALERLRKLDEAISCYNQAIAADGSLTTAYLLKGGLLNRVERFNEALECYEQALRSQSNGRG